MGSSARLFVPRLLVGVWLLVSLSSAASAVTGLVRGVPSVVYQSVSVVVALLAGLLALSHAVYRVRLDDEGVHVRRLRGSRHWPWPAVQRLTLQQAGTTPRLIVTAGGRDHALPGWGLRGSRGGDVEDAAAILRDEGAAHGVPVTVRRLHGVGAGTGPG